MVIGGSTILNCAHYTPDHSPTVFLGQAARIFSKSKAITKFSYCLAERGEGLVLCITHIVKRERDWILPRQPQNRHEKRRMTQPTSPDTSWIFPPRNGGIDYAADPSSAHFGDAPMPKLVREVVQNSLDAKHDGYSTPVIVEFSESMASPKLIGGESLERHIAACFDRAAGEGWAGAMAAYKRALETIRQKTIRCLKASDSGTVGLDDVRWNALVAQEGVVSKLGNSPGGNYGIGKNAALNVSDLQTVFYTTRYVAGRKGRVEKMQGKATLMGHDAPDGSGEALQHIGFYAERDGSPLEGRDIPQFFRLDETGTGVFVMGFNPRSTHWVHEMTQAVIENYFCAIADKKLIVKIAASKPDSLVVINHETIDSLFSQQKRPGGRGLLLPRRARRLS